MTTGEILSLGMLELISISRGIESSDAMLKAAGVEPLFMKTVCPGKFLAAVHGGIAAVQASLDAGRAVGGVAVVDEFFLANVHPQVVEAFFGVPAAPAVEALGVLESFSASGIVPAADAAVKAASVTLLDIRPAMGLGGKGYALLTGSVAAVQAAVAAGEKRIAGGGLFAGSAVIPRPAGGLWEQLL